jgi:outer membrane immunogenic protein
MKTTIIAATTFAASIAAAPADAADFGTPYTAPAPLAYSWMGPYLGLNLGGQWGSVTNSGAEPWGVTGGGQAGYNWQLGRFVFGVEGDLQGSSADDTFANFKFSNPWFGTTRVRAGVAFNNMLLYGTIGLAFGGGKVEVNGLSESNTHVGWAAGAGLEVGFTPNWSAKAEYLYVDLSNQSYALTGTSNGFESSIFRLGVNYRF